MSKERLRRKDLKGPDEFLTATGRVLDYARENQRQVAAAVVLVIGLVIFVGGVRLYRSWSAERAADAFRAAEVELAGGTTAEEAARFEAIAEAWPGSPQADLALLRAGNAYAEAGDLDRARSAFEKLRENASAPVLQSAARFNLAVIERQAGRDASEELRSLATTEGAFQAPSIVALASGSPGGISDRSALDIDAVPDDLRGFVRERLGVQPNVR